MKILQMLATFAVAAIALLPGIGAAQSPAGTTPTQLEWLNRGDTFTFGKAMQFMVRLTYPGPACPASGPLPPPPGNLYYIVISNTGNDKSFGGQTPFLDTLGRTCVNGVYTALAAPLLDLEFGTFGMNFQFIGPAPLAESFAKGVVSIAVPFTVPAPNGGPAILAGFRDRNFDCASQSMSASAEPANPNQFPRGSTSNPFGVLAVSAGGCTWDVPLQPLPLPVTKKLHVEYPLVLPSTTQVWIQETSRDGATAAWKRASGGVVRGNVVEVTVSSTADRGTWDGHPSIEASIALIVPGGAAPLQSSIELVPSSPLPVRYDTKLLFTHLTAVGVPCGQVFDWYATSYASYTIDGLAPTPSQPLEASRFFVDTCANGVASGSNRVTAYDLDVGTHEIRVNYSNPLYGIAPIQSPPLLMSVLPEFSYADPAGFGAITAFVGTFGRLSPFDYRWRCGNRRVGGLPSSQLPGTAPPGGNFIHGFTSFDFSVCYTNVIYLGEPSGPPESRAAAKQSLRLEFPADIPAGATVWARMEAKDGSLGPWKQVSALISGRVVGVDLAGAVGEQIVRGVLGIAMPDKVFTGQDVQGLWWGGNAENGWGLDISQSGDNLFAVLFTYDGDGRPAWYVMPSGQWDAGHFNFTGALYRPTGSPRGAYDASRFSAGASVGNATLSFNGATAGTLQYSIFGASGVKPVTKLAFGIPNAPTSNLSGLWWGGPSQAGWGVTMVEQGGFLFAAWYTYDASGGVTWLFAPAMVRNANGSYTGGIFRTTGAAWAGTSYDASRLKVIPAGTVTITPSGSGATMTFTVDGVAGSEALVRYPF